MLRLRTEVATKSTGGGKGWQGSGCWQQLELSTPLCVPKKMYDLNPSGMLNLGEFTTPIELCAQAQRQAVLVVHTTPIFTLLVFPYHWCKSRTYAPALSCTWLSYQPHLGSKFARPFMYNAMIRHEMQFIANPSVVRSFSHETPGVSFLWLYWAKMPQF
jgi:hypothetical protein